MKNRFSWGNYVIKELNWTLFKAFNGIMRKISFLITKKIKKDFANLGETHTTRKSQNEYNFQFQDKKLYGFFLFNIITINSFTFQNQQSFSLCFLCKKSSFKENSMFFLLFLKMTKYILLFKYPLGKDSISSILSFLYTHIFYTN